MGVIKLRIMSLLMAMPTAVSRPQAMNAPKLGITILLSLLPNFCICTRTDISFTLLQNSPSLSFVRGRAPRDHRDTSTPSAIDRSIASTTRNEPSASSGVMMDLVPFTMLPIKAMISSDRSPDGAPLTLYQWRESG